MRNKERYIMTELEKKLYEAYMEECGATNPQDQMRWALKRYRCGGYLGIFEI